MFGTRRPWKRTVLESIRKANRPEGRAKLVMRGIILLLHRVNVCLDTTCHSISEQVKLPLPSGHGRSGLEGHGSSVCWFPR